MLRGRVKDQQHIIGTSLYAGYKAVVAILMLLMKLQTWILRCHDHHRNQVKSIGSFGRNTEIKLLLDVLVHLMFFPARAHNLSFSNGGGECDCLLFWAL